MSRRQPPPMRRPHKLVAEMTAKERRQYALALRRQGRAELRELERPQREWALRQGRVRPCTMAQIEIFAADLVKGKQVSGEQ